MSILIKGMELPTSNHEIIVRIQSDGRVLDQRGHRFNQEFIAVPVPPHGRLIDADALYPIYADLLDGGDVKAVVPKIVIDTSPTIIPAEEGE